MKGDWRDRGEIHVCRFPSGVSKSCTVVGELKASSPRRWGAGGLGCLGLVVGQRVVQFLRRKEESFTEGIEKVE